MSIEIRITDPASESPRALRALAAALLEIAGGEASVEMHTAPGVSDRRAVVRPVAATVRETIAADDLPDAGADVVTPQQAFGDAGHSEPYPDPAQVFGAGNAAAASGFASSPNPALTGAASTTEQTAPTTASIANGAPSAANGEQGNAPGVTSPTPNGTPAAPSNGAAMAGVSIDARGLPWDVRIHAGTKTTNKDGSWKKKPNVDPALVAQVETELRAVMAIVPNPGNVPPATGASVIVPPPPTTAQVIVPPPPTTAQSVPVTIPPVPAGAVSGNAIPTPQASPPTTTGAGGSSITSFAQLLPAVTNAVAAGTLTEARVAEVLASQGLAVLPQLAPHPGLVAAVAAALFPPTGQ